MAIPSLLIDEAQVYRYWHFVQGDRDAAALCDGGYSAEPIAADLIVRMVERYLAEYRSVFANHSEWRI
jgi:hypothetical protein